MIRRVMIWGVFAVAVALIGLLFWLIHTAPALSTASASSTVTTPQPSTSSDRVSNFSTPPSNRAFQTGLERMPASVQGTEVDGEIIIDEQKNLVVTRRLRDLFDYFLNTLGEESLTDIRSRVDAYIRHRVPMPAQNQALDLFNRYVAYRDGLRSIPQMGGGTPDQLDLDAISKQKSQEQRLRDQFFSNSENRAFFGDEDAYDQYKLNSLRITQDQSLSEAQKAAQLEQSLNDLPDHIKANLAPVEQYQQLQQLTAALKERGASQEEINDMRRNLVGEDATQRLDQLDQQRSEFKSRVNQYLTQRQQITQDASLSPAQQSQKIQNLQRSQFTEQERQRLPALEYMANR